MGWLALDVGGANLKAADGQGFALSERFPLWQHPSKLADALRTLIAEAPPSDHLVATMTGELADCFETKREGVERILDAIDTAADRRHTRVYRTDGKLVSPQVARREPLRVAAANWHALASFVLRYMPQQQGLLIDIGSTTTDLIPLWEGSVQTVGTTDPDRLVAGELVYTGVERSPICALVVRVPWCGQPCPVAQEHFATTWDAYITLGHLPESSDTHTADGRPATKSCARDRLARQICADREMYSDADALAAAEAIREAQLSHLIAAAERVLQRMPDPPATIVISGRGEFLARQLVARLGLAGEVVSLEQHLSPAASRCATAHALAVLACEQNI